MAIEAGTAMSLPWRTSASGSSSRRPGWVRGHWIPAILGAMVALSFGAAGFAGGAVFRSHATAAPARPGQVALSAVPLRAMAVTSTLNAVIIGDSHAWLWAPRVPTIPDLGVPGANIDQIQEQLAAALSMHPRYVVVSAGTNDLIEGRSAATVAAGLSGMIGRIKASGAIPIVLLLPQYGAQFQTAIWSQMGIAPGPPSTLTLRGGEQVPAVNEAIRSLGVAVVQAPPGNTIDGTHMLGPAYTEITRQLLVLIG
jgi:hypothetical protein